MRGKILKETNAPGGRCAGAGDQGIRGSGDQGMQLVSQWAIIDLQMFRSIRKSTFSLKDKLPVSGNHS